MEMKEEDEDAEGGQEENCSNGSHSGPWMHSDCVRSSWRLGCSFLLLKYFNTKFPGGRAGEQDENSEREGGPKGSLIVSGMTGLWCFSRCLKEALGESEGLEAQLDSEGEALMKLREPCPLGGLGLWARSEGLGRHTGLSLISGRSPHPALLKTRCHHPHSPSLVQTFRLGVMG